MIFSSIHTKDDFKNYPAAVQRAIEYLRKAYVCTGIRR